MINISGAQIRKYFALVLCIIVLVVVTGIPHAFANTEEFLPKLATPQIRVTGEKVSLTMDEKTLEKYDYTVKWQKKDGDSWTSIDESRGKKEYTFEYTGDDQGKDYRYIVMLLGGKANAGYGESGGSVLTSASVTLNVKDDNKEKGKGASAYVSGDSALYVSSTGSDAAGVGDGTLAKPYRSISKAYNDVANDGTIYIMNDIDIYVNHSNVLQVNGNSTCKKLTVQSCQADGTPITGTSNGWHVTTSGGYGYTQGMIKVIYGGELTLKNVIFDAQGRTAVMNIVSGSKANIEEGVKLTGGDALRAYQSSTYGGGVFLSNSTLNMNGGEISGNSGKYAGGIYVNGGQAVFNMTGGTIKDNTVTSTGGGLHINNSATVNITGGTITGNTAGTKDSGGGVYFAKGILNISGNTNIYNNNAAGETTGDSNLFLTSGKTVGVPADITGTVGIRVPAAEHINNHVFAIAGDENKAASSYIKFKDDIDPHLAIINDGVNIKFTEPICKIGEEVYAKLSDAMDQVPNGSGTNTNIEMLVEEYVSNEYMQLMSNKVLTITTASKSDPKYPYRGTAGTNATIKKDRDCLFVLKSAATLTFKNINLTNNETYTGVSTSYIGLETGAVIFDTGAIMYNVNGRFAPVTLINGNAIFTMKEGSQIKNCKNTGTTESAPTVYAKGCGGAVEVSDGTFNMEGGTISGCNAAISGGGVYARGSGVINITGGTITGNTAASEGGVVMEKDSTAQLKVSGTVEITGNTVSGSDANIYLYNGQTIKVPAKLTGSNISFTTEKKPSVGTNIDVALPISGYVMPKNQYRQFKSDDTAYITVNAKYETTNQKVILAINSLEAMTDDHYKDVWDKDNESADDHTAIKTTEKSSITVRAIDTDTPYGFRFSQAVPEGTEFRLYIEGDNGSQTQNYYYYKAGAGGATTIPLDNFKKMGTAEALTTALLPEGQTDFRLVIDFEKTESAPVSTKLYYTKSSVDATIPLYINIEKEPAVSLTNIGFNSSDYTADPVISVPTFKEYDTYYGNSKKTPVIAYTVKAGTGGTLTNYKDFAMESADGKVYYPIGNVVTVPADGQKYKLLVSDQFKEVTGGIVTARLCMDTGMRTQDGINIYYPLDEIMTNSDNTAVIQPTGVLSDKAGLKAAITDRQLVSPGQTLSYNLDTLRINGTDTTLTVEKVKGLQELGQQSGWTYTPSAASATVKVPASAVSGTYRLTFSKGKVKHICYIIVKY